MPKLKQRPPEVRDHVYCFQQVDGGPKAPFVARLVKQLGSLTTGTAVLRYQGRELRAHRSACSTYPFDPNYLDEYRLDINRQHGICVRDPITYVILEKCS